MRHNLEQDEAHKLKEVRHTNLSIMRQNLEQEETCSLEHNNA